MLRVLHTSWLSGALVGPLKINGIGADSVQGDAAFVEYLVKMGAAVTRGENWIKTVESLRS